MLIFFYNSPCYKINWLEFSLNSIPDFAAYDSRTELEFKLLAKVTESNFSRILFSFHVWLPMIYLKMRDEAYSATCAVFPLQKIVCNLIIVWHYYRKLQPIDLPTILRCEVMESRSFGEIISLYLYSRCFLLSWDNARKRCHSLNRPP